MNGILSFLSEYGSIISLLLSSYAIIHIIYIRKKLKYILAQNEKREKKLSNLCMGELKSSSIKYRRIYAKGILNNYVLSPIKSGLLGFAAFFCILLSTKVVSYIIGSYTVFTIDIDDILLSIIGFILVFLIKFLENFRVKQSNEEVFSKIENIKSNLEN
jgi:hypothetical protein